MRTIVVLPLVLLVFSAPAAAPARADSLAARMTAVRAQFVARATALRIHDVHLPQDPAKQFAKLEASFLLDATYTNPFDPEDIDVQARVTLPDGTEVAVPAFYFVPYEPADGVTQLQGGIPFGPAGKPSWRVRFSPPLAGRYRLHFVATDAAGRSARSEDYSFEAAASAGPGFIRVAEGNPSYFEDTANGRPWLGIGTNVAWTRARDPGRPIACYEHYFGRARGLMSSTRVWMCHWAWLEWTPQFAEEGTSWAGYGGLDYYNQMIAAEFDRVFALAEENGLRVMLVTDDDNEHYDAGGTEEWFANPYNQVNGGPCREPSEFFSSPAARRAYRHRLRYIIARWGYSTSLWAINSWNDESQAGPEVRDWLSEMRDHVHDLVRGYRPLIYGSNFRADDLMDYAQSLGTPGAGSRPAVNQECEYTTDPAWFVPTLRHEIWGGLARGLAAVMCWPHTTVDRLEAWHVFHAPLAFLEDLNLNRGRWAPVTAEVISAVAPAGKPVRRVITVRSGPNAPGWGERAEQCAFRIDPDRAEQLFDGLSPYLYGTGGRRTAWRNPPTFRMRLPSDGEFVVDVAEIGGGDQVLEITVDGSVAGRVPLRGGRRELADGERRVVIPLPRGEHEISLDNTGGDWIRMHSCHAVVAAPSAASLVEVRGLCRGDQAFLYLQNQTYARLPGLLGALPVPLTQVVVRVSGLEEGAYRAILFDPSRGAQTETADVTCRNGAVTVKVSRLEDDLAVKLLRVRGGARGRNGQRPDVRCLCVHADWVAILATGQESEAR